MRTSKASVFAHRRSRDLSDSVHRLVSVWPQCTHLYGPTVRRDGGVEGIYNLMSRIKVLLFTVGPKGSVPDYTAPLSNGCRQKTHEMLLSFCSTLCPTV